VRFALDAFALCVHNARMPETEKRTHINAHQVRQVAVDATCDPRSVEKYLAGKTLKPMTRERIEKALRALGLGDLVQSEGPKVPWVIK